MAASCKNGGIKGKNSGENHVCPKGVIQDIKKGSQNVSCPDFLDIPLKRAANFGYFCSALCSSNLRSSTLLIFPDTVFGNSEINSILRGYL